MTDWLGQHGHGPVEVTNNALEEENHDAQTEPSAYENSKQTGH